MILRWLRAASAVAAKVAELIASFRRFEQKTETMYTMKAKAVGAPWRSY
jgi:hypothetical protein